VNEKVTVEVAQTRLMKILIGQRHALLGSGRPDSFQAFVIDHGRFFHPMALPRAFKRGAMSACYANSYHMLLRHRKRHGLSYAEGYAFREATESAVLHAWCVDGDENVYDRTWKYAPAYFGIAFKPQFVIDTVKRRRARNDGEEFGVIDDWKSGNPLLHELKERPDVWKA
jgi:hypothetical protein